MSQIIKSQALVLQSIRWHESSKIVTLFSREWGKIKVIARGALRKSSSFGGKLETLNFVEIIISQKPSRDLQLLTDVSLLGTFPQLRERYECLPYAFSILELLQKIFEDLHGDVQFFDFIIRLFQQMEEGEYPQVIFWYFLLKLSSFLGFKPDISRCRQCGKEPPAAPVYFSLTQGNVYCAECGGGSAMSRKLHAEEFRFLQRLQNFPHRKIKQLHPPASVHCDFTTLLLDYLNHHSEKRIELQALHLVI